MPNQAQLNNPNSTVTGTGMGSFNPFTPGGSSQTGTASSEFPPVTGTAGTGQLLKITGTFEYSTTSQIRPSVQTSNGGGVVKIGSYFKCKRLGDSGQTYSGDWS